VLRAHQVGLLVHVWTFRSERPYLNKDYLTPEEEYRTHFSLGIDGGEKRMKLEQIETVESEREREGKREREKEGKRE
jgi:hypothetical protein